jgi:phosphoglycerate dehydrogenase-like enzyme
MPQLQHGLKVQGPPRVIVSTDNVGSNLADELGDDFEVRSIGRVQTPEGLTEALEGAHALVTRTSLDVNGDILRAVGPGFSLVHGACKGAHVDPEAARSQGIEVRKADTNTRAVVVQAMAAILDAAGGWSASMNLMREGPGWKKGDAAKTRFNPTSKVLGIYGFGHIGRALAEAARAMGITPIAFNHSYEVRRDYDDFLESEANRIGVEMVDETTLLQHADILSLHIGDTDAHGRSNAGIITPEKLSTFGRTGLGVFINCARGSIAPGMTELDSLLREGHISRAYVDAHPTKIETSKFQFPTNAHPGLVAAFHVGGSGPQLANDTARDVAESIKHFAEHGGFRANSMLHPHQNLRGKLLANPSDISVRVVRSTERGSSSALQAAIRDADLEVVAERTLKDRIPGSRTESWTHVPHLLALNNTSGDYNQDLNRLAAALDAANKAKPGTIVAARFMPTTDEQKAQLLERNW